MVYTRRQNAKADANPSKTVFSKEQNDLLIQNFKEYSLYEKGENFHLFFPGFNESSTADNIKNPILPCLFDFTLAKIFMKTLQK